MPAILREGSYPGGLGSLLTPKRNDVFSDKKLDGLFLPVVHVAVQLIGVHT